MLLTMSLIRKILRHMDMNAGICPACQVNRLFQCLIPDGKGGMQSNQSLSF